MVSSPEARDPESFILPYMQRIERAVARDVNIDDLDAAMDHFLDVWRCIYQSSVHVALGADGFDKEVARSLFFLEYFSYLGHRLGQDVASEFHGLVKNAWSEIHSIKLVNLSDTEDRLERILSLVKIMVKHIKIFQDHALTHLHKCRKKGEKMRGLLEVEIKLADPSGDDGHASID